MATVKSGGGPGAHSPLTRLNLSSRVNSNVPTSQSRQFQWHLAYGSASLRDSIDLTFAASASFSSRVSDASAVPYYI